MRSSVLEKQGAQEMPGPPRQARRYNSFGNPTGGMEKRFEDATTALAIQQEEWKSGFKALSTMKDKMLNQIKEASSMLVTMQLTAMANCICPLHLISCMNSFKTNTFAMMQMAD